MSSSLRPLTSREHALIAAASLGRPAAGDALRVLADHLHETQAAPTAWALSRALVDRELDPLGLDGGVARFRFRPFADALDLADDATADDIELALIPALVPPSIAQPEGPLTPALIARTPLSRRLADALASGAPGDDAAPFVAGAALEQVRRWLLLLRLGLPDARLRQAALATGALRSLDAPEVVADGASPTGLRATGGPTATEPRPDAATRLARAVVRPVRRLPADDELHLALADPSSAQRQLATEELARLDERNLPLLDCALHSPHAALRRAALARLAQLPGGDPILADAARAHRDPATREAARRLRRAAATDACQGTRK